MRVIGASLFAMSVHETCMRSVQIEVLLDENKVRERLCGASMQCFAIGAMEILIRRIQQSEGDVERLVAFGPWECESSLIGVQRVEAARVVHSEAMGRWKKVSGRKAIIKIRAGVLAL